jgi:lysophosphatidic acid acyltransferase / lysophosphatidylinositol acyltransferase
MINCRLSVKITTFFSYVLWRIFDRIFRLTFEIEGENCLKDNEYYLVVSNHIGASDFMLLSNLFDAKNTMKDLKYLIKSELKYFLVFYQIVDLLKFISIDRNFEKDEKNISSRLNELIKHEIPANIVIYPEGSRLTDETLKSSIDFCRKKGLPTFTNVLCPRFGGFVLLCESLRNSHIKNVADITFTYINGKAPSLWKVLFTSVRGKIRYDIKIHTLDKIADPRKWLLDSFERKNMLIGRFKEDFTK